MYLAQLRNVAVSTLLAIIFIAAAPMALAQTNITACGTIGAGAAVIAENHSDLCP